MTPGPGEGETNYDDVVNPKEPPQSELDKDRAANPSTEKQVDPTDPASSAGG